MRAPSTVYAFALPVSVCALTDICLLLYGRATMPPSSAATRASADCTAAGRLPFSGESVCGGRTYG